MNVTAVKNAWIAALRDGESDLTAWCLTTYGRECRVFVGMDEDHRPSKDECPCVELIVPGRVTGPDVDPREYLFSAVMTLHDEDAVDHDDAMVTEHAGVDRLETFTEYVRDLFLGVVNANAGNASVDEHMVENNSIESFPFFQSGSLFRVTEPWTTGSSSY